MHPLILIIFEVCLVLQQLIHSSFISVNHFIFSIYYFQDNIHEIHQRSFSLFQLKLDFISSMRNYLTYSLYFYFKKDFIPLLYGVYGIVVETFLQDVL